MTAKNVKGTVSTLVISPQLAAIEKRLLAIIASSALLIRTRLRHQMTDLEDSMGDPDTEIASWEIFTRHLS